MKVEFSTNPGSSSSKEDPASLLNEHEDRLQSDLYNPINHPINFLLNLAQKRKTLYPSFLELNSGPVFTYACLAENLFAIGKGPCKKIAKKKAAEEIIKKLGIDFSELAVNDSIDFGDNSQLLCKNYVGMLHEYAQGRCYVLPRYDFVQKWNASKFTVTCSFLNYNEIGHGNSKREAKHNASMKVYYKVMNDFEEEVKKLDSNNLNKSNEYEKTVLEGADELF